MLESIFISVQSKAKHRILSIGQEMLMWLSSDETISEPTVVKYDEDDGRFTRHIKRIITYKTQIRSIDRKKYTRSR